MFLYHISVRKERPGNCCPSSFHWTRTLFFRVCFSVYDRLKPFSRISTEAPCLSKGICFSELQFLWDPPHKFPFLWSSTQLRGQGEHDMNPCVSICDLVFPGCYRPNVCILPKFMCGNPDPQCDIPGRQDLCEVIRSWGGTLKNGISTFIKGPQRAPSHAPPRPSPGEDTGRRHRLVLWTRNWGLTRHRIGQHPGLRLPAPRTVRNKFSLFTSPPVCSILLEQPEWIKTNSFITILLIYPMKGTLVTATPAPDVSPLIF